MVEETDFPACVNQFFLVFSETTVGLFTFSRKVFFNKMLHFGWWKLIFWLVETVFVGSEFFLSVETVTEINGSQFLKEDHIFN